MSKDILVSLLNDLLKDKVQALEKSSDNENNEFTNLKKDIKIIQGKQINKKKIILIVAVN